MESFSQITEYTLRGRLVRTIASGFTSQGTSTGGLAFDGAGYLYAITGEFSIGVYAPSSRNLVRTITDGVGWPYALATDAAGNLYVSNGQSNSVTVYPPGASSPTVTITRGIDDPASIAIDSRGNLYVANLLGNSVTVYAPGGSLLRTITDAVDGPESVALDKKDDLFVGNANFGRGTVTVYVPPNDALVRILQQGVWAPWSVTGDPRRIYVSNANRGTVTEYGRDHGKLVRKLRVNGEPGPIVLDAVKNLYVACYVEPSGQVQVYAPGEAAPKLTITDGILQPLAVALGPP
ncbi:MAG: SMP-30/gluconolactonase/LRE family protein [Candidatus Eremiobacteraeota bacterium]|nr:SMP-30/gluconolactonase/LRE family protein [Candidatus Eremiobacteraeota bacterium]